VRHVLVRIIYWPSVRQKVCHGLYVKIGTYTLKLAQFLRPYVRKNHTISYYKDASFLVFSSCTDTCLKVTFVQCLTTARYRMFLGHFSISQQRGELPVTQTECWTSQLEKPTMNCKSSEVTVEYVV